MAIGKLRFYNLSEYGKFSERLQNLSLSYFCNRMDLIMTYKILNEAILVDKDYFFTINTSHTRSNGLKK